MPSALAAFFPAAAPWMVHDARHRQRHLHRHLQERDGEGATLGAQAGTLDAHRVLGPLPHLQAAHFS